MIELGELERRHADFERRNTRVVAASIEGLDDARKTQADYPHLKVVADQERGLIDAVGVLHAHSAPDGGDTSAPTTIVLDPQGVVRWLFRPSRVVTRLSPDEV